MQNNPVNYIDPMGLFVPAVVNPYTIGLLTGAAVSASAYLQSNSDIANNIWQGITGWFANESNEKETGCHDAQGKPGWPGDDPSKAPSGTEWKGKPGSIPGSKDGNYHNPDTKESYRPDLDHGEPIGPHWDYRDPSGGWNRIFPDGRVEPK